MTVSFGEAEAQDDNDPDGDNNGDIDGSQRRKPLGPAAGLLKGYGHQHNKRREEHERPLRLHLVFYAADEKEYQCADAIHQQAADKGIFNFNPESLVKEEPAHQRARHQELPGNIGQAIEEAVFFAGAFEQMIVYRRIAMVDLPQDMGQVQQRCQYNDQPEAPPGKQFDICQNRKADQPKPRCICCRKVARRQ